MLKLSEIELMTIHEKKVTTSIVKGHATNAKKLAKLFNVETQTMKNTLKTIYQKLSVKSMVDLVIKYYI